MKKKPTKSREKEARGHKQADAEGKKDVAAEKAAPPWMKRK